MMYLLTEGSTYKKQRGELTGGSTDCGTLVVVISCYPEEHHNYKYILTFRTKCLFGSYITMKVQHSTLLVPIIINFMNR